jgi:hypothetical protein
MVLSKKQGTSTKMFDIKDSGKRQTFESGMVRESPEDKVDYSLVMDGPMLERWAVHLTKGAKKYSKRNWMKACGQEELDRFKESAVRHFFQWYHGHTDEDHAAAVFFNINGAAYAEKQMLRLREGRNPDKEVNRSKSGFCGIYLPL